MRVWARAPRHSPELQQYTRRYFLSGCIVALVLTGAYTMAQYPYDNLCNPVEKDGIDRSGVYLNVGTLYAAKPTEHVTVTYPDAVVFCQQNWRNMDALFNFPPTSKIQPDDRKWMTEDQEFLADLYGWTAFVYVLGFVWLVLLPKFSTIKVFLAKVSGCKSCRPQRGKSQMVDFSSVPLMWAYIPNVKLDYFTQFPLLACDIDYVCQDLIGWRDPSGSYDMHNLIFDVPCQGSWRRAQRLETHASGLFRIGDHPDLLSVGSVGTGSLQQREQETEQGSQDDEKEEEGSSTSPMFSICRHYPMPWHQDLIDKAAAEAQSSFIE